MLGTFEQHPYGPRCTLASGTQPNKFQGNHGQYQPHSALPPFHLAPLWEEFAKFQSSFSLYPFLGTVSEKLGSLHTSSDIHSYEESEVTIQSRHSHSRGTTQLYLQLLIALITHKSEHEGHWQRFLYHPLCLVPEPMPVSDQRTSASGSSLLEQQMQRVQVIQWISSSVPKETTHLVQVTSFIIGVSTEYTHTYCFLYHTCLNYLSISSLDCIA